MSKIKRFGAYTVTVLPQTLAGILARIEDRLLNLLKIRNLQHKNTVC